VKAPSADTHERLAAEEVIRAPSDRSFGVVIAAVLGVVGLSPLVRGRPVRWWSVAAAAVFFGLALALPRALAPLNRLWLRMGLLLHAVINPVIMALLFYTTVTPIGLVMRVLGKTPLRLQIDRRAATYWIPRSPPGPSPDTMRRQF
jgi:hypothetical protein